MPDRPLADEYATSFERYVVRVPERDVLDALTRQGEAVRAFLAALPAATASYRYAPDKWTVQQVVAHVIDSERIFAYRALCVARGEEASLPGFDENAYVERTGADPASLAELGEEFALVRGANLLLFRRFDEAAWRRRGDANRHPITPRALVYIMAGHVRHHAAVLAERYGLAGAPA